jgi:hypothetical protein
MIPADEVRDDDLLCYCTRLTVGELRAACRTRTWPPPTAERTGKLCTGCMGDLQYLLREFTPEQR